MVAIAVAAPGCNFGSPGAPDGAIADAVIVDTPDADTRTWWDRDWKRRRRITIKNDALSGDLTGFPVLVRLPAEVVTENGTGKDLRFLAADHATELGYQIDTIMLSGAVVWVRIPTLTRTGPAPELWVYYDNPAATPASSGAAVFADQYVSVHHLGNDLGDSTDRGHTATSGPGQTPSLTTGQIGEARDFDGTDDYLLLMGSEADFDFTTQLSVSAWIRRQVLNAFYQAIVCKGDTSWRLHREEQTPFVGFGTTVNNTLNNLSGSVNIDNGNWHHVAIVFAAGTKQLYVDGQLDTSVAAGMIDTNDLGVMFGRNEEAQYMPNRYWNGDIDEVRISAQPRDQHWIFAEHHTATATDFVQLGAEETAPP